LLEQTVVFELELAETAVVWQEPGEQEPDEQEPDEQELDEREELDEHEELHVQEQELPVGVLGPELLQN